MVLADTCSVTYSLRRAVLVETVLGEGRGTRIQIEGYEFKRVCDIDPVRDGDGSVLSFLPQERYDNASALTLNKFGRGPFCKFGIAGDLDVAGVYAITVDGQLRYVGETESLSRRFNMGYGNISPRNCFRGGQETNCRLNNLIYFVANERRDITLWFLATSDYKAIETRLRSRRLPWNRI